MSFRHPLKFDGEGKPGRKVRKSLGTTDDTEADARVQQLNELLSDEKFWSLAARPEAEQRFQETVVEIFYDGIQPRPKSGIELRDSVLQLPSAAEGYVRIQLVGQTGAGKTTLLRELIGTGPEKFPSTSAGRCTTAEIEVITADEDEYQGVVTFRAEALVRTEVQECLLEGCGIARHGGAAADVAEALLKHPEGHFTLKYTLGRWPEEPTEDGEEWTYQPSVPEEDEEPAVGFERLQEAEKRLVAIVNGIRTLADVAAAQLREALGRDGGAAQDARDQETTDQWFDEIVQDLPGFARITTEIVDEILARFDWVENEGGQLQRQRNGWPVAFQYADVDRKEFLRLTKWFSSIHAGWWGELLTPLVEGIRLRGRFTPSFLNSGQVPRYVLIDGEGMGHRTDNIGSVPPEVSRKFEWVDVILLVDSAVPAMLDAPLSVLKTALSQGYQDKIAIVFTHFDQVEGPNLRTVAERRRHVLDAVRNALSTLRDRIDPALVRSFEDRFTERSFFFVHPYPNRGLLPPVARQLLALDSHFRASIERRPTGEAAPRYHSAGITIAVQGAAKDFLDLWRGRLARGGVHWKQLWALDRRIAQGIRNHYRFLQPVSELHDALIDRLSDFVAGPAGWTSAVEPDEDARRAAINRVRQEMAKELLNLVERRVIEEAHPAWVLAFTYSGPGSGRQRARDVRTIMETAAPEQTVNFTDEAMAFLADVEAGLRSAVEEAGGVLS